MLVFISHCVQLLTANDSGKVLIHNFIKLKFNSVNLVKVRLESDEIIGPDLMNESEKSDEFYFPISIV